MGLRVTGGQSLPVRPCFAPIALRWCFEEPKDRVSILRDANNGWASTSPNKLNGLCNPRVQAVVNGTTQCGRFQQFSLRKILRKWNGDFRFKCDNSSGRIGTHFFGRLDLHAIKVDRVSLCSYPHNGRHACCQSSRDEICRRKRFPLSFIIDRSIR